jgi:hypothetical protein
MNKPVDVGPKWFQAMMLPIASKSDVGALRSFALTMAIAIPLIFMLVLPWLFEKSIPNWPIAMSMALALMQIFKPSLLYPIYLVWIVFASALGWLNTHLIMFVIFYFIIVPIGLFMRLINKLQFKHKITEKSAWVKNQKIPSKENLKEPF